MFRTRPSLDACTDSAVSDPDRDETLGSIAASKVLIICHDGDDICDNGITIRPQHRNYEIDAPTAATFVASKVQ
jgi:cutinase